MRSIIQTFAVCSSGPYCSRAILPNPLTQDFLIAGANIVAAGRLTNRTWPSATDNT